VTKGGRICYKTRKVNLSQVLAGQNVDYDLGYFDDEMCRLEPIENPFGPRLLPMSPE
jgi:putative transposase